MNTTTLSTPTQDDAPSQKQFRFVKDLLSEKVRPFYASEETFQAARHALWKYLKTASKKQCSDVIDRLLSITKEEVQQAEANAQLLISA